MKKSVETIAFWVTLLTGVGLVFIGSRFLLVPPAAETAFGIKVSTGGNYSFHYIKGIRDIFSGAIITILLLTKEFRALGIVLLCGSIIPMVDFSIVYAQANHEVSRLYPHLTAIIVALAFGVYYLRSTLKK